ncbi:MAG: 2Fe-2S iron-sulfur cluster-binding protein [Cyanobacteria bacterium P01_D01_bin.1]
MTVQIRFLPDDVTTTAKPGEALLDVAHRAGVHISTGCLMGSCYACEVEMTGAAAESVRACLTAVPETTELIEVNLLDDPTW